MQKCSLIYGEITEKVPNDSIGTEGSFSSMKFLTAKGNGNSEDWFVQD